MTRMLSGDDKSKLGLLQFFLNKKNILSIKTKHTGTKYLFSMTYLNWKQYCLVLKSLSEYDLK